MANIVMLRDASKHTKGLVGKKAVNLALLSNHFSVPPACIITSTAFNHFLEQTGVEKKAGECIKNIKNDDEDTIIKAADSIKDVILRTQIPESLFDSVKEAYFVLESEQPIVAVRPSSIGYDGKDMHTSVLNVRGIEKLHKAILTCWASYFSPAALAWHVQHPERKKQQGFAIIVQKMIDSQAAGELHTHYKMNYEEALILGCKGLGAAISNGLIVPDKYFITKENLAIASIEIGKQTFMLERDFDTDKTTKVYLQDDYAKKQKIPDRHLGELTLITKKLEKIFSTPQILDFAIYKDTLYFLSAYEPAWYKEQLQEKQQEAGAERFITPTDHEIEEKETEISVKVVNELNKDMLVCGITGQEPTEDSDDISIEEIQEQAMQLAAEGEAIEQQQVEKEEYTEEIEILEKRKQQKGNLDLDDLVQSIDPQALEAQMLEEATRAAEQHTESDHEIIIGESVRREEKGSQIFTEQIEDVQTVQQAKHQAELSSIEKATGSIIIQCFKEYKAKIPQEKWATHPEFRHLAVLAKNFADNKIPPTKDQLQYALDAVEKLNKFKI